MFHKLPNELLDLIIKQTQTKEKNPIELLFLRNVNSQFRNHIDNLQNFYKEKESFQYTSERNMIWFCKHPFSLSYFDFFFKNNIHFNLGNITQLIINDRCDVIQRGYQDLSFVNLIFNRFYINPISSSCDIFKMAETMNPLLIAVNYDRLKIISLLLEKSSVGNPYLKMIPSLLDLSIKYSKKDLLNYLIIYQWDHINDIFHNNNRLSKIVHRIEKCEDLLFYLYQSHKITENDMNYDFISSLICKNYNDFFIVCYKHLFTIHNKIFEDLIRLSFQYNNGRIADFIIKENESKTPLTIMKHYISLSFEKIKIDKYYPSFLSLIFDNHYKYLYKELPVISYAIYNGIDIFIIKKLLENKFTFGFTQIKQAVSKEDKELLKLLVSYF